MTLTYRPAAPADFAFLYRLHELAMRSVVEQTYGPWDDAYQRARFTQRFDPRPLQIIQWDGADVGVIHVEERSEELFLANLEILPAYQNRGIGAYVLSQLLERASAHHKPVALQVLKANESARRLYERLGFVVTGEKEHHYIMAWGLGE